MKLSVLVPTYRRTKDLERCLNALKQQCYPASEILVVVRDTDDETHRFLQGFLPEILPLRVIDVATPGQVAALNAGLQLAKGDIVAITDDDAAPHSDWLEKIRLHFLADDRVGAVGGRDWVYESGSQVALSSDSDVVVGRLQWFGRSIGNHHLGTGEAREVDILKGANMSYRREAITGLYFNERLKGKGAQVNNDMDFSLSVKKKGWKIIYDPKCAVNHYPSPRFDEDQRDSFNFEAYYNAAYNQTLILLNYQSTFEVMAYLFWSVLIGTRGCFGLLQAARFIRSQRMLAFDKWFAASSGHTHAFRDRFLLGHTDTSHPSVNQIQKPSDPKLISSVKP
jgi:cellulose synthase/poly-beta-1,6-N-acetylglucosamine synthase-like glycosyltransferase